MKQSRRRPDPVAELRESGLLDRSERPTTHELFAPTEEEKQREEDRLLARVRQARRRRWRSARRVPRSR